ncbi:hypothetical protein BDZ89DRAFT_1067484 [Hymenopellis radicata]|nr:hypothetical protein BDZ89DRAFT_1067484 [Hymenopellis radicata]
MIWELRRCFSLVVRRLSIHGCLKTLETFGLGESIQVDQRKKIVYASRSHGGVSNGGRRVLNEDVLLDAIREKLTERGQGEELVLFHEKTFGSQEALMAWFHENVRAVIGPHGGALFNHRW